MRRATQNDGRRGTNSWIAASVRGGTVTNRGTKTIARDLGTMSRMIARSSLLSVAFAAALLVPARAGAQVLLRRVPRDELHAERRRHARHPGGGSGDHVSGRELQRAPVPVTAVLRRPPRLALPPPRQGRSGEAGVRFGVEVEFIHLKVYAETRANTPRTGQFAGLAPGGRLQHGHDRPALRDEPRPEFPRRQHRGAPARPPPAGAHRPRRRGRHASAR